MTAKPINWSEYTGSRRLLFEHNLDGALRTLLQDKHLYQTVTIQATDKHLVSKEGKTTTETIDGDLAHFVNGPWSLEPRPPLGNVRVCHVLPPDVKLFCKTCERLEPFNLVFRDEVFRRIRANGFQSDTGETEQAFVFGFECQSCKGTPTIFLVRRRGLRVTNAGRSPIEHVTVPGAVPKIVQRFFSGAIVAHQSGQTLAGLFLLRTLVEQWARSASDSTKREADQVMEEYMATLPKDFRDRFPSMRSLYADLSADIHAARGSSELFDKARVQIEEHFEARRVFRLPSQIETKPSGSPTSVIADMTDEKRETST